MRGQQSSIAIVCAMFFVVYLLYSQPHSSAPISHTADLPREAPAAVVAAPPPPVAIPVVQPLPVAAAPPAAAVAAPAGKPEEASSTEPSHFVGETETTRARIAPNALNGYRGEQSQNRWKVMQPVMEKERGAGTIIDYGAAFGFFSMLAADLNRVTTPWVLSVDDQRQNRGLEYHSSKIAEYELQHCLLCNCQFSIQLIDEFVRRGVMFHIQFVLSIFHWLPIRDENHHKEVLGKLLSLSPVSFIELPHRLEGPGDQRIWYGSRREPEEAIRDALAVHGDTGTVEFLGQTMASYEGGKCQRDEMRGKVCYRKTFVVRNASARARYDTQAKGKEAEMAKKAIDVLKCTGSNLFYGLLPT